MLKSTPKRRLQLKAGEANVSGVQSCKFSKLSRRRQRCGWDQVIHPSIDDGSNGVVRIALQMEELP
jgi:hypothetical protein